ncbi:MAG TPA: hypothetical protein EYF93_10075 [Planctomycetes bacterium]|nr:hypothetical protein [Planctomycetota bacterium]
MLSWFELHAADLHRADLHRADLHRVDLHRADPSNPHFIFIGRPSPADTSHNTEQKRPSPQPIHHCSVARDISPST